MTKRELRLIAIAGLMVVWSAFDILSGLLADKRVPVAITKTVAINSPVPAGENLVVRIWREKVRDCPLNSERYVSAPDGSVYDVPDVISNGGPVGSEYVDVAYNVGLLPEGFYNLHATILYICEEQTHIVQQPITPFEIIANG